MSLAFFIIATNSFSQCPSGTIILSSQAQVDQFIIDYPNCTELDRLDVTLGADITNVDALINLERINGDLNITHNPILTNLNGFSNLKSSGYLWIANNSSLSTINAFGNLEEAYWLFVGSNNSLETIGGFNSLADVTLISFIENPNLNQISTFSLLEQVQTININTNSSLEVISLFESLNNISQTLTIENNPRLTNLSAFSNVNNVGNIVIKNNEDLTNITGLNQVTQVAGQITIENNTQLNNISGIQNISPTSILGLNILNNSNLSVCNLSNICTYLEAGGPRTILGNAGDCMTEQILIDVCFPPLQCPVGNLFLSSQGQVDNFIIEYPECTIIDGVVIITNNISNLDGLSNLESILGGLDITFTSQLSNLDGLSNLSFLGGYFLLQDNIALSNLIGLNNLTQILGSVGISSNNNLTDISGLQNVNPSGITILTIDNNSNLSVCNLPNICTYLLEGGQRTITGNAGDCISEQVLTEICFPTDLPGEFCSNAIDLNDLFGQNLNVPQLSSVFNNTGLNSEDDPDFGFECLANGVFTSMWFSFKGDGNVYRINSNQCSPNSPLTDPRIVIYSGVCSGLTAVACHDDINFPDDPNFSVEIETTQGLEYFFLVDGYENGVGNFCLEVTNISEVPCTVNIPDANFKTYLIGNSAINTNGDDEIQCEEADAFTGTIDCTARSIANLEGIQSFVNIDGLLCDQNQLSQLDISNNILLTELNCNSNDLERLDVRSNSKLTQLFCNGNSPLMTVNLANGNNEAFTLIQLNGSPALECIQVDDVAYSDANWMEPDFIFDPQHFFSEDCTAGAPDGEFCDNAIEINSLFGQSLNEPQSSSTFNTEGYNFTNDPNFGNECLSENGTIWFKFTGDGQRYRVRSRDCSARIYTDPNGAMYSGSCSNLTSVNCHRDIWTGDIDPDVNFRIEIQTAIGVEYFLMLEVTSSEDLVEFLEDGEFCLEVTRLEPECFVHIPDPNFKAFLVGSSNINMNGDNHIQCEEAAGYFGSLECSFLEISTMKGLEAFVNIFELFCDNNNISELNVSSNTSLTYLNCSNNRLTSLNLANGINEDFWGVEAKENPLLECVKVDNSEFSQVNWTEFPFVFDEQIIFSEDCAPCEGQGEDFAANFLTVSHACSGEDIHFIEYSVIENEDLMTFQWDFGDGSTSTERDPVHAYTDPGPHLVSVTINIEGCTPAIYYKTVDVVSCLKKEKNNNGYTMVMPNPSTGSFRLESHLPIVSDIVVRIYNTEGKPVYNSQYTSTKEVVENIVFDQPGIYIAEISHILGTDRIRIVILR